MWLAVALPTPNGVDLADGVADSAAEAGQLCCGAFHLGHGALEPGLKAGEDTRSPNPQPHLISKRLNPSILRCYVHGESKEGGSTQGEEKLKPTSKAEEGLLPLQRNLRISSAI